MMMNGYARNNSSDDFVIVVVLCVLVAGEGVCNKFARIGHF